MKKIFKLGIILSSALILSACSLQTKSGVQNNTSNQKFSLKDLISQNVSQKCTWEYTQDGQQSSGEMLVKGNKFNQTVKMANPNGETEMNSISDGQWVYTWTNDSTTGNMAFKIKMEDQESSTESDGQSSSAVNWDQQYEYHCSPTVTSDSDFQPPKNIEFLDMNDYLESMKSLLPSGVNIPQ